MRASDSSFQIRWIERSYTHGALSGNGALDGDRLAGDSAAANRRAAAAQPAGHLRQRPELDARSSASTTEGKHP